MTDLSDTAVLSTVNFIRVGGGDLGCLKPVEFAWRGHEVPLKGSPVRVLGIRGGL